MLYLLNEGIHWCPDTLIINNTISNKIPEQITHTTNFISLHNIINKCSSFSYSEITINNIIETKDQLNNNEGSPIPNN